MNWMNLNKKTRKNKWKYENNLNTNLKNRKLIVFENVQHFKTFEFKIWNIEFKFISNKYLKYGIWLRTF